MDNGHPAPGFTLSDLDGHPHQLQDERGWIVIVNFWSADCPHAARVDESLLPLLKAWRGKVHLLQIASNGNEPREMLRAAARQRGLNLVLHDVDHQVADAYAAQTTPHFFVLDEQGLLRYQGAYDDVTFRQRTPTRNYVEEAVAALLNGSRPPVESVPPFGCALVRF
jgi:peroxiredoxin